MTAHPAAPSLHGKRYIRTRRLQEQFDNTSRQNIWRWVKAGYLPKPIHIGAVPFWDEEEIDAVLKGRRKAA